MTPTDPIAIAQRRAIWEREHAQRIGWHSTFEAADADPLVHSILRLLAHAEALDRQRREADAAARRAVRAIAPRHAAPRAIDQKSKAAGERDDD